MFLTTLSSPHTPRKAELYANLYSIELIPILFLFFFFFVFWIYFSLGSGGSRHMSHYRDLDAPKEDDYWFIIIFPFFKKKNSKIFQFIRSWF